MSVTSLDLNVQRPLYSVAFKLERLNEISQHLLILVKL